VHGRWLHVQLVERWWQLVSSIGREVAGGRAAVTHARSQSGRRLEASLTGGGMCGAWSRGGSRDTRRRQRSEAGKVRTAAAQRAVALHAVGRRRLSGTVALGRAQFGAQYHFAIIQTLLRFQNAK
jgi:hypothetical protein